MAWPDWIEALRKPFLADEASAFLLHGAVTEPLWDLEGEKRDAVDVLVQFFRTTRQVVGVLRPAPLPSRLEFADFSDRARFDNLVRAYEVVEGRTDPLDEGEPQQALGRIWRALSTAGTNQAYIVTDTARLAPAHRKRVDAIPGAPELLTWPSHPVLRRSNNVLVFVASHPAEVRPELASGAAQVELRAPVTPDPEPPAEP